MSEHTSENELQRCRNNFRYFAERYLIIVDKSRRLKRLELNPVQRKYHAARTDFDIILKARKVGITTYKCAEYFHNTIFVPNTITTISKVSLWRCLRLLILPLSWRASRISPRRTKCCG